MASTSVTSPYRGDQFLQGEVSFYRSVAQCGAALPLPLSSREGLLAATNAIHKHLGANYGYGPKPIISETETLRSETFYFP